MIKVIARNYLKEGSKDEVLKLAGELIDKTRLETGCISYEMFQSISDSNEVTFIETWESPEALQAHTKEEHFTRIVPQIGAHRASEMQVDKYTLIK
jgi:quinol monooxygenase YgiN